MLRRKGQWELGTSSDPPDAGCEFDAVSVGELKRVQQIGVPGDDMIFSGVGKRDDEIEARTRASVKYICVESEEELMAIASIAASLTSLLRSHSASIPM